MEKIGQSKLRTPKIDRSKRPIKHYQAVCTECGGIKIKINDSNGSYLCASCDVEMRLIMRGVEYKTQCDLA